MAKSRKNAAASDIPLMPQVGDNVALQLNPGIATVYFQSLSGI
jgi:hypothetical protein